MAFLRTGDYYTVGTGGQFLNPSTGEGEISISVATDGHWISYVQISPTFVGTPVKGILPLTVNFSDTTSLPAGLYVDHYEWSFGDGTTLSGNYPNPTHQYIRAGRYNVTMGMKVCEV